MSTLTPAARTLRARLGAYALHSQRDVRETSARGREVFRSRFEKDVDPDGVLPIEERKRRAEAARKAHYTRMALASVRARAEKARRRTTSPAVAA